MNMLDYIKNPDTWLSLAAIVVSVIALFQTAKQTKLSNKQHLFDRRLEKYVLMKDLLGLYKQNREYLVDKTELAKMVDLQFSWLVNCSYLTDMNQAMQTYNEVEENIAAARRFYNSSIKILRNSVEIFPGCLFASCAGKALELEFFETDVESKKPINASQYL